MGDQRAIEHVPRVSTGEARFVGVSLSGMHGLRQIALVEEQQAYHSQEQRGI
jgi:hypothetical protein